jgi:type II secretory pathway pseudopilin PulG
MKNSGNILESAEPGFSLLELMIVVAITFVLLVFAIPVALRSVRTGRLRGASSDYASMLQAARTRAVQDDRFYSVYLQPAAGPTPQVAYVDIYPQAVNGTSGHGAPPTGHYDAGPPSDPSAALSGDAVLQAAAAAPSTANLYTQFCASCTPPMINTTAPPTFGPAGLPCLPVVSVGGTGTVCNSATGPTAFVTFLQSAITGEWAAVTVTPAGRIKTWYYESGTSTWAPQH